MDNKRVLIFADHYLPGYKAGGPIKSISNISERLGNKFDIYIITRIHDLGALEAYPNIVEKEWTKVGLATVMYVNSSSIDLKFLRKILKKIKPEVIHFNSLMSLKFTFLPILVIKYLSAYKGGLIISPRGELSNAALSINPRRKKIYLAIWKLFNLIKNTKWIAASDHEKEDIMTMFGLSVSISRINNFPSIPTVYKADEKRYPVKRQNQLNAVYLSRIAPIKNLAFLLTVLKSFKERIKLTIYGPEEDQAYISKCKRIIVDLPDNVEIIFSGPIESSKVSAVLFEYDLFILPTLGENFGQVIWEALVSSVPILISNNTPWKDLTAKGIGWDIDLGNEEYFLEVLYEVYKMDSKSHSEMRERCHRFALNFVKENKSVSELEELYSS